MFQPQVDLSEADFATISRVTGKRKEHVVLFLDLSL